MPATVSSIVEKSDATVEDTKTWVKSMKEKGRWSDSAARMRLTALDALASVLGPDEVDTATYVLENAQTLQKRWAISKNADGETAQVYGGSARSTLKLYLAYLEDPTKAWQGFDAPAPKARKPKKAGCAEGESHPSSASETGAPPASSADSPRTQFRSYPLGDGRVIEFSVPENFTVRDLAKVSCHLATYCSDFDPARPMLGTVGAIARLDEQQH
jgi:hypothetical protein